MAKASKQTTSSEEVLEQPIVEEQVVDKDPGLKTRAYKDMNYKRIEEIEEVPAAVLDGE